MPDLIRHPKFIGFRLKDCRNDRKRKNPISVCIEKTADPVAIGQQIQRMVKGS